MNKKNIYTFVILILLVILLIILLVSYSTSDSSMDDGLLTDKPCKAPCFNGLTPGQATALDIDQFIKGLNAKKWAGIDTSVQKTGCKVIQISDKPGMTVRSLVRFYINDGKLTYILSSHDNMPTLKQIAEHLGPPEYTKALNVIGPDGSFYSLDVFYPKQGVAFKVSVSNKELGFIKPEMKVSDIEYYEPGDLLNYYLAKHGCNVGQGGAEMNARKEIDNYIQPWAGFGSINVIDVN